MAYLKPDDTVIIDSTNFEKFMDYRSSKNLKSSWGWMHLPAGTLMEVKELIFRTTGRKRRKKTSGDEDSSRKRSRRGTSCWVKCKIVTPVNLSGEEHTIPSWILKKSIVSHISSVSAK